MTALPGNGRFKQVDAEIEIGAPMKIPGLLLTRHDKGNPNGIEFSLINAISADIHAYKHDKVRQYSV